MRYILQKQVRLALAMVAVWLSIALPASAQDYRYGMVTNILGPEHADRVRDLGAGWVRVTFFYQYDDNYVRGVLAQAQDHGQKVFATLNASRIWTWAEWQARVEHIISIWSTEYPTVDVIFGVLNEPNLHSSQTDPGYVSPADYAWYFDYAVRARNNVNPSARLAGPEVSSATGTADIGNYMPPGQFFQTGDIISVHWYPGGPYLIYTYMGAANQWAVDMSNWYGISLDTWLTESGMSGSDSEQLNRMQYVINAFNGSGLARWTNVFPYILMDGSPAGIVSGDPANPATWINRPAFDWYRDFIAAHP